MKLNTPCYTSGSGLWSRVAKPVNVLRIDLAYENTEGTFGELRAYFDPSDWDVHKDGLIYTDDQWLQEFRAVLVHAGLPVSAAKDVDYSEQGMQGDDYVSLDVGENFLDEWVNDKGVLNGD